MKKCALTACAAALLACGCGSPPATHRLDAEIERNTAAAKSAYTTGATASAALFYQKALARARLADQPLEIARSAYNLAACLAEQQKYQEALELLDEAQYESEQAGLDFQEVRLLRAEIARSQGQTDEAQALARSGINAVKNPENDPYFLQLQIVLAESACDRSDGALALKELAKVNKKLLAAAAPIIRAKAAGVQGRALLLEKRPAEAAICFDHAAALYREAQRYFDMAISLHRSGDAYERTGKRQEAFNRYYRAARSLILCGENTRAQESFNQAKNMAEKATDKQMLDMLARLRPEICQDAKNKIPPSVPSKK